jgi:signal recognition particle subunit SRP72
MVEDYGDAEIEYELAPVSAQLAYVQQVTKSGETLLLEVNHYSIDLLIIFSATRTISRSCANLC